MKRRILTYYTEYMNEYTLLFRIDYPIRVWGMLYGYYKQEPHSCQSII